VAPKGSTARLVSVTADDAGVSRVPIETIKRSNAVALRALSENRDDDPSTTPGPTTRHPGRQHGSPRAAPPGSRLKVVMVFLLI